MIVVTISINNRVIASRTARNTLKDEGSTTVYNVDTGETINHVRSDGAVVLAKKMLDTIREVYR